MLEQLALSAILVGTSLATALAALALVHLLTRKGGSASAQGLFAMPDDETVFLFEDEDLIDATDNARALLAGISGDGSDWTKLCIWLAPRFPEFLDRIGTLAQDGPLELTARSDCGLSLRAEWRQGVARIILIDPEAEGRFVAIDRLNHRATEEELQNLRRILELAPLPIWQESAGGTVTWANPAYLGLASARDAEAGVLTWPLPRLFAANRPPDSAHWGTVPYSSESPSETTETERVSLTCKDGQHWFDKVTHSDAEGGVQGYALPADSAQRAESSLQEFIRTLGRTFANLPIGLAIFDRQRRLQLFNPALTDLTTLGPGFLSARPSLTAFFDALRECSMIPEPRDYKSWRAELTEVENSARAGRFEQCWSLPGGQTYRVTGQPHPDGAVAFLIEDISAETSIARRFRAEIDTGQAVLNGLPDAVAVFSCEGVMVMSNDAYTNLWCTDPNRQLSHAGVSEVLCSWQEKAHHGPHWAELRALLIAGGARRGWVAMVQLRDGRHLSCRLTPLSGGASMVSFSHPAARTPPETVPDDVDRMADSQATALPYIESGPHPAPDISSHHLRARA